MYRLFRRSHRSPKYRRILCFTRDPTTSAAAIVFTGGPECDPKGSISAEPVPVSAFVGSSKNLKDLTDQLGQRQEFRLALVLRSLYCTHIASPCHLATEQMGDNLRQSSTRPPPEGPTSAESRWGSSRAPVALSAAVLTLSGAGALLLATAPAGLDAG